MIYLDNSATTRPCAAAVAATTAAMEQGWANPSALYSFGFEAAKQLREARHQVAAALQAEPERIYFTSGGTEADNWAIFGAMKRMGKRGKHMITTEIEHHAVLNCFKQLEAQGFCISYLKPDASGCISAESFASALRRDTVFASVMMVNNETGAVMPIDKMARLLHTRCPDAIFHTDAVQGFLKIPFKAKTLGADLISISSHKVHGPKGVGALYISPRLKSFPPLLYGGGQESGYRSGTEATPAIAGFAAACTEVNASLAADIGREELLKTRLIARLEQLEGVNVIGAHQAPHIICVSIPGVPTQNSINLLQERGICVSAGSACAKGHRSHVLSAMGLPPRIIDGAFRISLARDTTQDDIDQAVEGIMSILAWKSKR